MHAYVDADIFALPSYTENFGMVVIEAMACGLPVVISDQVNIHSEVAENGAGVIVRCDIGELTTAISALLDDAARRQAMGVKGRDLVLRKWTWKAVASELQRQYEEAITRHRGQPAIPAV